MTTRVRNLRKQVAQETLSHSETLPVPVTKLYNLAKAESSFESLYETKIMIVPFSVVDAIYEFSEDGKLGVLNFASAKNPGGGFIKGSMAQEEALCYSSNLYQSLKDSKMYDYNKDPNKWHKIPGRYHDLATYSSDVTFFRHPIDSDTEDGDPMLGLITDNVVQTDVISIPAPNLRFAKSKGVSVQVIQKTMKLRVHGLLTALAENGCETIILGAFGCGVFGNDPHFVSNCFLNELTDSFQGVFKRVIFAIPKSSRDKNYAIFCRVFRNEV